MLLPGKLDRALKFSKEQRELREGNITDREVKLEKLDGLALMLSALLTFMPVILVLLGIALFCLYS
ncbi:hypothetical protein ACPWSR_00085 [Alloiococcus sp. CFN-8]|uniref:hypothetical protein n=1 Tax=Alloiococcus sp. CFN-8 TaxID=3416081 RepID=UPI003CE778FC